MRKINQKFKDNFWLSFEFRSFDKKARIKKIQFGNLVDRSYFSKLFFVFVLISMILTWFLVDMNDSRELVLIKFISIIFLLMLFSVFLEMPKNSEYISLIDSVDLRHFFRDFVREKGEGYAQKYDAVTQRKVKELFRKGKKFELSNIIKKEGIFILTFHRDVSKRNFIWGFLLGFKLHKLYVKDIGCEYKVVRLK